MVPAMVHAPVGVPENVLFTLVVRVAPAEILMGLPAAILPPVELKTEEWIIGASFHNN